MLVALALNRYCVPACRLLSGTPEPEASVMLIDAASGLITLREKSILALRSPESVTVMFTGLIPAVW